MIIKKAIKQLKKIMIMIIILRKIILIIHIMEKNIIIIVDIRIMILEKTLHITIENFQIMIKIVIIDLTVIIKDFKKKKNLQKKKLMMKTYLNLSIIIVN